MVIEILEKTLTKPLSILRIHKVSNTSRNHQVEGKSQVKSNNRRKLKYHAQSNRITRLCLIMPLVS